MPTLPAKQEASTGSLRAIPATLLTHTAQTKMALHRCITHGVSHGSRWRAPLTGGQIRRLGLVSPWRLEYLPGPYLLRSTTCG